MRISDILHERTNEDVIAQTRAMAAYHLISQYVYSGHGPDFTVDTGARGTYYGLDSHKVGLDPEFNDMAILIGPRNLRSAVMSGALWRFETGLLHGKYSRAIVVDAMRDVSEAGMRQGVCNTEFITTFQHEFIHVLDSVRTKQKIMGGSRPDGTDKAAYYNDPAEFNAFFHTFAEPWLSCLHSAQQEPESARDMADMYGISGVFATDLKHLIWQTRHNRDFFNHLRPERRKSIIRRLYRLHQEMVRVFL